MAAEMTRTSHLEMCIRDRCQIVRGRRLWFGRKGRGSGKVSRIRAEVLGKDDVVWEDDVALAEKSHRSNDVAEFAQVPAPLVGQEFVHGFRMDRRNGFAEGPGLRLELRGDQSRKFLPALAQGGDEQLCIRDSFCPVVTPQLNDPPFASFFAFRSLTLT